jgi:hypothetical protein
MRDDYIYLSLFIFFVLKCRFFVANKISGEIHWFIINKSVYKIFKNIKIPLFAGFYHPSQACCVVQTRSTVLRRCSAHP